MRIVICHSCWSWIPLTGTTCSECHLPIDLTKPDPTRGELSAVFGELVSRIATVRLERRKLPSTGTLIGTTQGLLFVPFLETRPDGAVTAHTVRETTGGNWSFWRFWRRPGAFPAARLLTNGQSLRTESDDLVAAFLDAPGAIFLPRDDLVRLQVRHRTWTVGRQCGSTLRMTLLSPPDEWRPAWRQLLNATPAWHLLSPR